jgi:hypothetical protein
MEFNILKNCIDINKTTNTNIVLKKEYIEQFLTNKQIPGSLFYRIIKKENDDENDLFNIWLRIVFRDFLPLTITPNTKAGELYEKTIIQKKYGSTYELQKQFNDEYFICKSDAYNTDLLVEIKTLSLDKLFYINSDEESMRLFFNPIDNLPIVKKTKGKYNELFCVKQASNRIELLYNYENGIKKKKNINEIINYIFEKIEPSRFYKVEKIIENIYQVVLYMYILRKNNEVCNNASLCYVFLPKEIYFNDEANQEVFLNKFNKEVNEYESETIEFSYEEIIDNKHLEFFNNLEKAYE